MTHRRYTIGVDPGLSGAVALYDPDGPELHVIDMPTHAITVGRSKRRQLDLYQLGQWFDLHGPSVKRAIIEEVSAMPKQGVSSTFAFGFAAGAVQGIVAAQFIPMQLVRPHQWKRALGLTSDKDASRRLASRMLPRFSSLWARVKDDGRAEATLLAIYGSKMA